MKRNKIVYLAFIVLFFIACKNEKKTVNWQYDIENIEDMFNVFNKEYSLKSEIYIGDTFKLNNPFKIKIFNKYLIINDKDEQNIYSVFDMRKEMFACRFLYRGKGSNEYLLSYMNIYNNDTLIILNNLYQKLAYFSKNKIDNCNQLPDTVIYLGKNNEGDNVEKCFRYRNGILTTGQFKSNRFYLFKHNGKLYKKFGEYPRINSKVKYDNYHLGFIFGGEEEIVSNYDFSKFACLSPVSMDIYENIDMKDTFRRTFSVIWQLEKLKEATYKNGKPYVVRYGNGEKIGAGKIAANDKYLFFPFSKYEYMELYDKGLQDYYGYIFVMDWNGNPVARLKLDKRIQFSLDVDNGYIYSIHTDTHSGFSQIIRYDIKFLDKTFK